MVKYVHWNVKFKGSKFLNTLAYLNYLNGSFRQFYLVRHCIIHFIREREVEPEQHVEAVDDE